MHKIRFFSKVNIVVLFCSLALTAHSQPTFEVDEVRYKQDFSTYELNSSLERNGWTASGAKEMIVTTPNTPRLSVDKVIRVDRSQRGVAISPNIELSKKFQLGDTIFLSAKVWSTSSATSGIAVGLQNSKNEDLFFLRLRDDATRSLDLRGVETTYVQGGRASRAKWYELLIAVELHPTNVALSTGSLFFRELGTVPTSYKPVAGLQQVQLGFNEQQNPLDIGFIRIEQARNNAEISDIRIGTGTLSRAGAP